MLYVSQPNPKKDPPLINPIQRSIGWVVKVHNSRRPSMGTGIIVGPQQVLTVYHLVASHETRISLQNGMEYQSEVIASEANNDLALLKVLIDKHLSSCIFATEQVILGQDVMAIGHPFGYSFSITKGVISGLNRNIMTRGGIQLTNLMQTDTSINPGNSGGPLLNMSGEVIGLNVAIRTVGCGMSFTVPAAVIQQFLLKELHQ